jgi:hypothetical protein
MKLIFLAPKHTHCKVPIDLVHGPQDWSTKLHASLDNTCPVIPNNPIGRLGYKVPGGTRCGILECKLIEAQADLRIGCCGEVVEIAEVGDVRWWELGVHLKALEEDNYNDNGYEVD